MSKSHEIQAEQTQKSKLKDSSPLKYVPVFTSLIILKSPFFILIYLTVIIMDKLWTDF